MITEDGEVRHVALADHGEEAQIFLPPAPGDQIAGIDHKGGVLPVRTDDQFAQHLVVAAVVAHHDKPKRAIDRLRRQRGNRPPRQLPGRFDRPCRRRARQAEQQGQERGD